MYKLTVFVLYYLGSFDEDAGAWIRRYDVRRGNYAVFSNIFFEWFELFTNVNVKCLLISNYWSFVIYSVLCHISPCIEFSQARMRP